ncbi:MAG: LysM peptidoglycan-binding domain-containing protein [Myxococcaceae bacterium]|nr:LysM peptidoglycan-binding domain-containing protein [Myxococcaceae bacterium]
MLLLPLALILAQPVDAGAAVDAGVLEAQLKEAEEPTGELEEMRALEESAIGQKTGPAAPAEETVLREALLELGYGQGTRERLLDGLDAARAMGGAELLLDPVSDVEKFDVALVRDRYDIPVEMHPLVAQYIRFFQGAGRKWFRRWMSRSTRYVPMMTPILESQGLPRDLVYLAMIESGFNTSARSWAAAVGPWQFIQATGKRFGLKQDFWVDERRDWVKATVAAGQYLKELHDEQGHWYLAWAGYNSGGGRVRQLVNATQSKDFWVLIEAKRGFAKETKHYVPKLIACALVARYPAAFGFTPDEFQPLDPLEYEELPLTQQVDLDVLARAGGFDLQDLEELNPELKRWCTPPASAEHPYVLRVPKGKAEPLAAAVAKLSPAERLNYAVHRVKKGDTLSAIAAQYHSATEAIMHLNGLKSARSLRVNNDLIIPVPSPAALKAGKDDPALTRQVAQARRAGVAASRPQDEIPAGTQSAKAQAAQGTVKVDQVDGKKRVIYGIAPGDSLWSIGQRFDCSVGDLRNWNEQLATSRKLKVGAALTIWPGPKAELPKG